MSPIEAFLAWSGWAMSALATFALVLEWRAVRRERRKNERLVAVLSRVAPDQVHPVGTVAERDERLRSLLIRAAARDLSFGAALREARRTGAVDDEVGRLATALRDDGLLAFNDPLTAETTLQLNR